MILAKHIFGNERFLVMVVPVTVVVDADTGMRYRTAGL